MRIYVHDYAGHPFQVQLSRALAARGHAVRHGYSSTNLTPHGALARRADDPAGFEPDPIALDAPVEKRKRSLVALVRRRRAEAEYGRRLVAHVERFAPEVVLAANTPLDALGRLQGWAERRGVRLVNWLQDLLSVGTHRVLRQRLGPLGEAVGRYYVGVEQRLLRRADAVVLITEDFRALLTRWGVAPARLHVVENWAPLGEVPVRPRDNAWARAHGLADASVLLYAGTLGMKHDPELLLRLAQQWKNSPDVRVVVVSEGPGADWLHERKAAENLDGLVLLPFQPFEAMPDVLGAADMLLAVLEPDAGVFSVPSKVLTYLCAGRPLLLAVPPENLAARIVARTGAGVVVPPTAPTAFAHEAQRLLRDPARRERMSHNARAYAEATFDVERIADRFETILAG